MQKELIDILGGYNGENQEECGQAIKDLLGKKISTRIRPILHHKDKVEKLTDRICRDLCEELTQLDIDEEDVDNWIYTYATVEAFFEYSYEHGKQFHSTTRSKGTYRYALIDDDQELSACVRAGMNADKQFAKKLMNYHFSVRKVVLFQMFVMERCSVDEICDYLRADQKVIKAKLAEIRKTVMCFDSMDGEKGTVLDSKFNYDKIGAENRADSAAKKRRGQNQRADQNTARRRNNATQSAKSSRSVRSSANEAGDESYEDEPVTKRDRIISYAFIGIFLAIGIFAGTQKVYARYGASFWLEHTSHQAGWDKFEGKRYYFDENGEPVTGWTIINNEGYYFDESYVMEKGWALDQRTDKWYYLRDTGVAYTEWQKIDGSWYYFDMYNGEMKQGWLSEKGKWYYLDGYGKMVTGWLLDNDKWYYFGEDGIMLTDQVVNGYTLGADGARME